MAIGFFNNEIDKKAAGSVGGKAAVDCHASKQMTRRQQAAQLFLSQ